MNKLYQIERTDGHIRVYLFGMRIYSGTCLSEPFLLDVKKFKALKNRKEIQTLILGSSHGRDGFLADSSSFNLSGSSLDLYRIYHLYCHVQNLNFSLKNIIIFYDVFHPGLQLEKTKEALRAVSYNFLYKIPLAFPINEKVHKKEKLYLKKLEQELHKKEKTDDTYYGNVDYPLSRKQEISTEDLVSKHLKNNLRGNNQNQYIEAIAEETLKHGQNLFVVTPPYRSDYLKKLPSWKETFKELLETAKKYPSMKILNFQNDPDFNDTDFYDADHLNKNGAEKLTQKINLVLKQL